MDRDKVIKALQNCSVQNDVGCQCCPYFGDRKTYGHEWCTTSMAQDTLALLKEQEEEIQSLRRENHDILTQFHEWAKEQKEVNL